MQSAPTRANCIVSITRACRRIERVVGHGILRVVKGSPRSFLRSRERGTASKAQQRSSGGEDDVGLRRSRDAMDEAPSPRKGNARPPLGAGRNFRTYRLIADRVSPCQVV